MTEDTRLPITDAQAVIAGQVLQVLAPYCASADADDCETELASAMERLLLRWADQYVDIGGFARNLLQSPHPGDDREEGV